MKKRSLETPLYAVIGLLAMLALLVGINVLVSAIKWRADLTEERAFTLSDGTRRILANLESPVQVRFYYSQSDEAMPMALKHYAQNVNDLLDAMRAAAGGRLQIQRLDPRPDSDAEDSARLDGVDPQIFPNGDRIYLGLSFSQLDRKTALPFLAPDRERLLEYDIARAVLAVTNADKPVIGLLTPLSTAPPPIMMHMMERPASAGVFFEELRRSFEVRELPFRLEAVPDDIDALLVVHPRNIPDVTEFAIDQFVLRGGRLVAFLDPLSVMDVPPGGPMVGMSPPSTSTLPRLLPAWGVEFNTSEVVVDMENLGSTRRGRAPGVLALGPAALDPDSVVTASLDSLFMALAGAYGGEAPEGVERTSLVFSSVQSEMADPGLVQSSPQVVDRNFRPSGEEYALAIKLEGTFRTAFPGGAPSPEMPEDTAPAPGPSAQEDAGPVLEESVVPTTIYLVADVDMLFDPLAVAEMATPFGRPVLMPANGNLDFAQNLIEQVAGGDELAAVRSRASRDRPFTVVRRMQAEAEAKFRDKISELEQGLRETQGRLAELQRSQADGQQFILSAEQQEEIRAFRQREAETKRELKDVRRTLRREVEALEQRIKWTNIAAMPLLVAAVGLIIALVRHRRQRAR